PRDLAMIRDGLKQAEIIRSLIQSHDDAAKVLKPLLENLKTDNNLAAFQDQLKQALLDEPPALARDGGFIAKGYHGRLDEQKMLRYDGRRLIAGLQNQYQKDTGVDGLKIKFNNVLCYLTVVTARHGDTLMVRKDGTENYFIYRQTMP